MKIHPQSDNSIINCSIIYVLLLLLLGCNGRPETGSCNQFCGDTQRISVQTRDQCAALGKASGCPTQWLPHGANPDDRNAWITVYPVPEVQVSNPGPDTTPPPQPDLAIELTANNEILLHISPGDGSQKDSYEVTRNGAILPSKYSDKYTYRYDLLTDELAKYCYAVVAIDPSGNRSVSSAEHCLTSPVSPLVSSTDFLQSNQTTNNSVVGSDGTIYGGLRLNALNPDGTLKWTSSLPNTYILPVIGADGVIYSNNNTTVYAFLSDGTVSWSYQFSNESAYRVKVSSDTVYVATIENKVIDGVTQKVTGITALNLGGTFKWKYVDATNRYITLKVLGTDGTPYLEVKNTIGNTNEAAHQIQALNMDGTLKWEYVDANNSGLILKSVGSDGKSYIGAKISGTTTAEDVFKLQALNTTGTLYWEHAVLSDVNDVEIATDGSVYLTSNSPRIPSANNPSVALLEALNSNGVLKWNYTVDLSNETQVSDYAYIIFDDMLLANDGKLYLSDGHKIHSLNPNGTVNWISEGTYSHQYKKITLQLINNDTLIYLDTNGENVRIISRGIDGVVKWRYAMRDEDAYYNLGPNQVLNQPLKVLNQILIFGGSKLLVFPL